MVRGAVESERFLLIIKKKKKKKHFVLQLINTKSTKKLSGKQFLGERATERGKEGKRVFVLQVISQLQLIAAKCLSDSFEYL